MKGRASKEKGERNGKKNIGKTYIAPRDYSYNGGTETILGVAVPCGSSKEGTFFLNVASIKAGGTANLLVTIYTYNPVMDTAVVLTTFTSTAVVGNEIKSISANLGDKIKVGAVLSGGAGGDWMTFSVGVVLKS